MTKKIVALLVLTSAVAIAQSSSWYVFAAPGGATSGGTTQMSVHFGGGVDALVWKGVGVNAELGAVGPRQRFTDGVMGVFSPGGSYYFRRGDQKVDPFVTGGYSLFFRTFHENLAYIGGGTNYWFSRILGLRMEFRDHIHGGYDAVHFWGFRFGLAFR